MRDYRRSRHAGAGSTSAIQRSAGKATLTSRLGASHPAADDQIHDLAAEGTAGMGGLLPYLDTIQGSFGHHQVGEVRSHIGGPAAAAAEAMSARAFASGNDVAFAEAPDLHLAAHEAAHVVQQRGGVRLAGGVGRADDVYELHADAVADRVVRGESAEALLDTMAHRGASGGPAVQRDEPAPGSRNLREDPAVTERRAVLARLDAADRAPAPPGDSTDFVAPNRDPETERHLRDGNYAGAVRALRPRSQPTDARHPTNWRPRAGRSGAPYGNQRPTGVPTADDVAEGAHMRRPSRALDAPEPETTPETPPPGVRGTATAGTTPGTAGVGAAYSPRDGTPGATTTAGVNLDGEYNVSVPLPGNVGAITAHIDPQAGTGDIGAHLGSDSGTHAGVEVHFHDGHLGETQIDGQVGRSRDANARAALHVDERGRLTRAELGGQSGRAGPRRRRLGGKLVYQATFGAPTLDRETNQYEVAVDLSITVDVTGGLQVRAGELSANIGGNFREHIVRPFGSEADAQTWIDGEQPDLYDTIRDLLRGRLDPQTAMELEANEEVELRRELHGGGTADLGIPELSVRLGASSTFSYRRIDDHTYRVGRAIEGTYRLAPGLQTAVAGSTMTFDHASRSGRIVEFDLSTEGGRRALAHALDTGDIPDGDRGPGWRLVERSEGTTDTTTQDLDAVGSHGAIERGLAVDVTTDAQGHRDITARGWESVQGDDNELDATDALDDAGRTRTEIEIDDDGADIAQTVSEEDSQSSQQALAGATGTLWHMDQGEHEERGTWHAQVHLSDFQMRTVWQRLRHGDGRRLAYMLATRANLVDDLTAAARQAPSAEEARPAVAAFSRDGGDDASHFLRALAGGQADFDVVREGSTVFQGAEGRGLFAMRIDELEQRFRDHPDDAALETDVRTLLREQQARLQQMNSHAYSLPPEVRQHEVEMNQPLLERARHLSRQVSTAARRRTTTAAHARTPEEVAGDDAALAAGRAPMSTDAIIAAGPAVEQRSHDVLAAWQGDEHRMLAARRRTVTLKQRVQAEYLVHHTAGPGGNVPYEFLTGLTGPSDDDYDAIRTSVREADSLLAGARTFYQEYEDLRARVPDSGLLDAAAHEVAAQLRRVCWSLTTSYQRAFDLLEQARVHYVAIRRHSPNPLYWGTTHAPQAVTDS